MSRAGARLAAYALLVVMFARMLHAATLLSPVVDEQSHISRGLSVLRTGDLRLRIGHPIGLNAWQALPLALDPAVGLPLSHESWANAAWDRFGEQFLWRLNTNPDGIVFRSRVMVMLLALVLGAIVFRWASERYGARAGVLALALYTLDPNVIAHGLLATTDLGVTLFMCAAVCALWRAARASDRRRFFAAGALAGLALASKYSALFILPIAAVLLVLWKGMAHRSWSLALYRFAFVAIAAALVVLAIYLLRIDLYIGEFAFLLDHTETHPSFLLGQRSIEGWWHYFLVTFFLKTPLPALILIGAAAVTSLRRRAGRDEMFLIAPPLLYFVFSVVSGFNIGYRHLLPALPFLFVFASKVAQDPQPARNTRHGSRVTSRVVLLGVLVLWLALSSFAFHPDYLAYFNEASPSPHYDVLVDSNLDWGQSLKQLRAYLNDRAVERVKLSYFGTADPAAYDIDYDPLPRWPPPRQTAFVPANPAPGVYAISASNYQGILLDDPSAFDWFHHRRPDAVVGHSILVYHIAADPNPPQAVGLCRVPWTPLDEANVDALFGRNGLRVVRFDCANAWWRPGAPAWYVVPPELALNQDERLVYEQRRRDDSTVFGVIRLEAPGEVEDRLEPPASFEGGLTLLGFNWPSERRKGRALVVESVWQVERSPEPPVSIFAHLLDAAGAVVIGADGFGAPAELLRSGDVMKQRHRFDIPLEASEGEYRIAFGFYRLDTLERYPVVADGRPVDDRVLTEPFVVTP